MVRIYRFALLPFTLLLSCTRNSLPDPSNVPQQSSPLGVAKQTAIRDGKVLPVVGFTRGINLGNGLDAPSEGEWGVVLDVKHFEMAKAAGFDHVRLPVRFSAHAAEVAPFTIDTRFFERVDWALDQAQHFGLNVILDLHHYNELMDDPNAHFRRFVALWQQISDRYENRPTSVAFELLNEPSKNLDPNRTNALYSETISLIRKKHPKRTIFVDSYFWANTNYLRTLKLPDDAAIVAQFHMYQPILFTHQGAPWMGPEYATTGVVFPGPPKTPIVPVDEAKKISWVRDFFDGYNRLPTEKNPSGMSIVVGEFERAYNYAKTSGHRVYLGEFAAIDKADQDSRYRFLKAVRGEAEKRGIGWCYWDDGGMNKAMNIADGTWVKPIDDALLK
jgi:endoglucanase